MVCVGGLPVQPQPPSRRRDAVLTQGPPVSPTQCVAPWPPTHPCGAPAPLSLPVDCDRGQPRLSQSTTSSHIHHRSFRFLLIATPPSFSQLSGFFVLHQHLTPLLTDAVLKMLGALVFRPPRGFGPRMRLSHERATQTHHLKAKRGYKVMEGVVLVCHLVVTGI